MEILAASHLVENDQGVTHTVYEIWRSVGWHNQIEFKLAGGETVELLASDVFVVTDNGEILTGARDDCQRPVVSTHSG